MRSRVRGSTPVLAAHARWKTGSRRPAHHQAHGRTARRVNGSGLGERRMSGSVVGRMLVDGLPHVGCASKCRPTGGAGDCQNTSFGDVELGFGRDLIFESRWGAGCPHDLKIDVATLDACHTWSLPCKSDNPASF